MTTEIGYGMQVTLVRGPGFPPEKLTLAQAVREVMKSPIRAKLHDATIICESILVEGVEKIEAIYARSDFPEEDDA